MSTQSFRSWNLVMRISAFWSLLFGVAYCCLLHLFRPQGPPCISWNDDISHDLFCISDARSPGETSRHQTRPQYLTPGSLWTRPPMLVTAWWKSAQPAVNELCPLQVLQSCQWSVEPSQRLWCTHTPKVFSDWIGCVESSKSSVQMSVSFFLRGCIQLHNCPNCHMKNVLSLCPISNHKAGSL